MSAMVTNLSADGHRNVSYYPLAFQWLPHVGVGGAVRRSPHGKIRSPTRGTADLDPRHEGSFEALWPPTDPLAQVLLAQHPPTRRFTTVPRARAQAAAGGLGFNVRGSAGTLGVEFARDGFRSLAPPSGGASLEGEESLEEEAVRGIAALRAAAFRDDDDNDSLADEERVGVQGEARQAGRGHEPPQNSPQHENDEDAVQWSEGDTSRQRPGSSFPGGSAGTAYSPRFVLAVMPNDRAEIVAASFTRMYRGQGGWAAGGKYTSELVGAVSPLMEETSFSASERRGTGQAEEMAWPNVASSASSFTQLRMPSTAIASLGAIGKTMKKEQRPSSRASAATGSSVSSSSRPASRASVILRVQTPAEEESRAEGTGRAEPKTAWAVARPKTRDVWSGADPSVEEITRTVWASKKSEAAREVKMGSSSKHRSKRASLESETNPTPEPAPSEAVQEQSPSHPISSDEHDEPGTRPPQTRPGSVISAAAKPDRIGWMHAAQHFREGKLFVGPGGGGWGSKGGLCGGLKRGGRRAPVHSNVSMSYPKRHLAGRSEVQESEGDADPTAKSRGDLYARDVAMHRLLSCEVGRENQPVDDVQRPRSRTTHTLQVSLPAVPKPHDSMEAETEPATGLDAVRKSSAHQAHHAATGTMDTSSPARRVETVRSASPASPHLKWGLANEEGCFQHETGHVDQVAIPLRAARCTCQLTPDNMLCCERAQIAALYKKVLELHQRTLPIGYTGPVPATRTGEHPSKNRSSADDLRQKVVRARSTTPTTGSHAFGGSVPPWAKNLSVSASASSLHMEGWSRPMTRVQGSGGGQRQRAPSVSVEKRQKIVSSVMAIGRRREPRDFEGALFSLACLPTTSGGMLACLVSSLVLAAACWRHHTFVLLTRHCCDPGDRWRWGHWHVTPGSQMSASAQQGRAWICNEACCIGAGRTR